MCQSRRFGGQSPTSYVKLVAMSTIVLSQAEVRRLLPMRTCIELVASALAELGRDEGWNPLRQAARLRTGSGLLGMMPGHLEASATLGLKVVCVMAQGSGSRHDSHQGLVVLFSTENGTPLGIFEASEITSIRTAAASAVATRALARAGSRTLGLLGTGIQARAHLEAMLLVRPFERVLAFSPDRASCATFARTATDRHGVSVEAVASAREAVRESDVVCTVTSSSSPVLQGTWLRAGTHVNAVGACMRHARELDGDAVRRCRLFVDRLESAREESGDFLLAVEEGCIGPDHIVGELGDVLLQRLPGRRNEDEITLFDSVGLAIEDLAAARHLLERAEQEGAGTRVDLTGLRG